MKENMKGDIESLGFHVIASRPGLSISKKETSGCLGDRTNLHKLMKQIVRPMSSYASTSEFRYY